MKQLLSIFTLALIMASCQPAQDTNSVDGKKALLKEKKAELKALQAEISTLSEEILKLEPPKEKAPVLISTQSVKSADFKRYTSVQGYVDSDNTVFVSSETGGRILTITAKEGQSVRKGQLLVSVDLKTLNDQKAELQTSLDLAKDVFTRQKRLWDQNIGTEISYLQAKNNVDRLEKSLATLDSQIAKANVYAPISGVVDMELMKPGEMSAPGQPILQILNTNSLKVVADVPESYLGKIKRGEKVEIYFPAIDKTIEKTVNLLGRTIDPSNRTFKVEVNTSSLGGMLKPNLLAEMKFNDYSKPEAISVPLEVVQQEVSGKKYVFVMNSKGDKSNAMKKYVETGEGYDGKIIIENGLELGDKIIMDGAKSVANGDPVRELK